ncbi:hypothetical protein [Faecalicoccus sp.]|uniref:hypothetical protein n=1 Tax=Faecalicoccus sp. TaxID=1971758 RepID=UPI002A801984|nr:hypothetical protein [Faecalicoccus sp.]MDY5111516.1 hypothetical protein [Faecalicoccus sp.]
MSKLTMRRMKMELRKNDRIWKYLTDIAYPGMNFDNHHDDYDDALNTLTNAKLEDPRLLLWIDAFYQTGRDIDWHYFELPEGGPLEQLRINFEEGQNTEQPRNYLAGKTNLRSYVRDAYKWIYYLMSKN